MIATLNVLCLGKPPPRLPNEPFGPFVVHAHPDWSGAARALRERPQDAMLVWLDDTAGLDTLGHWDALPRAVLDMAVIAVAPDPEARLSLDLVREGLQDLLPAHTADAPTLARALRLGVERKRIEIAARKAFATDLTTGLPNRAQLREHMSHLLALREREPAPMALLVLRVDGLASTEQHLGAEAANVLRRKVAVRLRAGLRASDVVAAIGDDSFAVLLAWIDSSDAGLRVAAKLAQSLQQPFKVAGQGRAVAVNLGVSQYPEHGKSADELLHRALGQAYAQVSVSRAGHVDFAERGPATAANDDDGR